MTILNVVKRALLIPRTEKYADEELKVHINSCKDYLKSCGVSSFFINDDSNFLVKSLIIIYVKTFFGFKNDGSVKELPKSFHMLVQQASLTKGEHNNVS